MSVLADNRVLAGIIHIHEIDLEQRHCTLEMGAELALVMYLIVRTLRQIKPNCP